MRVKRAVQYVVMASSEPAELARVTGTIAGAGVDLAGVVMTRAGESLQIKFVVKARRGLRARLESRGVRVIDTQVLLVEGESLMEVLDSAARALAPRGVDILSCYRCFGEARSSWVLSVDKLEVAEAALETAHAVAA